MMRRLINRATAALLTLVVVVTAVVVGAKARTHAHEPSPSAQPIPAPTTSRKLDEYGNIPFEDEKPRLENMAIELRNDPAAKGYIIGYAGRRARRRGPSADRAREELPDRLR